MSKTIDTAALESLRTFAASWGSLEFAHLCTAAINGEDWAADRLAESTGVSGVLCLFAATEAARGLLSDEQCSSAIRILGAIDASRPDGAVARSFQV